MSFPFGRALIFFLILAIFPSVTDPISVPLCMFCQISLFPFSMLLSAIRSMIGMGLGPYILAVHRGVAPDLTAYRRLVYTYETGCLFQCLSVL